MRRLGLALLASAIAVSASSQSYPVEDFFELEELDDGVYAAVVVPRPPSYVFANALVVLGAEGVLVVDTQQSPAAARALAAEIRRLTEVPVRFVVNTHWHGDHVYGNAAYREAFPRVSFIGHTSAREDVIARGHRNVEEELETLPESIREREGWLASGVGPGGVVLDDALRDRVTYSRDARRFYLQELGELELVPPDVTFESALTLHLGDRRVDVLHFGRAHTRGDVVVHLPEEGILAGGDLIEDAFPYFGDAYPAGWANVLGELQRLDARILVPSHGPVQRDTELLDTEVRMMKRLVGDARAALGSGMTLEAAQEMVRLEEFQRFFTNDDPERIAAFRNSVREAVARAYMELEGELGSR